MFVPRYCLSFTAEEGTKLMSSLEGNTSITLLMLIGHKYHSLVNLTLPLESANISPALYIPYLEANVDLLLGHCYCMNTIQGTFFLENWDPKPPKVCSNYSVILSILHLVSYNFIYHSVHIGLIVASNAAIKQIV